MRVAPFLAALWPPGSPRISAPAVLSAGCPAVGSAAAKGVFSPITAACCPVKGDCADGTGARQLSGGGLFRINARATTVFPRPISSASAPPLSGCGAAGGILCSWPVHAQHTLLSGLHYVPLVFSC